jgi:Amt family ammonium transporter
MGKVNPMPGSNLALATLGMFILWLGWFGFNGGSQLAMGTVGDVPTSRASSPTPTWRRQRCRGRADPDAGDVRQGRPDHGAERRAGRPRVDHGRAAGPSLGLALIIGAIGGLIVVLTVPMLDKMKIDDVVGAIPVHLFAGIWGTLAVAFYTGNWFAQIVGIVAIGAFVFVTSAIVWAILKATMGIRVSQESEVDGLDVSELGMEAYPDFQKG